MNAAARRVGVLGGSFDPPHCGHVMLASYALAVGPIDALLVVPAFAHAFGKQSSSFEHRVAMCREAFSVLDPARVSVSEIERELPAPSFTYRTVEALAERMPGVELRWIIGTDIETDRWKNVERITELAPFLVVGRAGHDAGQTPELPLVIPEVSSTALREAFREGRPVTGLVSASVERYARTHGLYRDTP